MEKVFTVGGVMFKVSQTDLKWSSKDYVGSLPISSIISINYSSGFLSLVSSGFVEKIKVGTGTSVSKAAINLNNVVSSVKSGDFEVLQEEPIKPNPMSKYFKWGFVGVFLFVVFVKIFSEKSQDEVALEEKVKKEAFDKLPQATKDSIQKEENRRFLEEAEANMSIEKKVRRDLKVENWGWEAGGFGTVGILNMKIKNQSDKYTYSDLVIRFTTMGESGTKLDANEGVIYKTILPKKTIRVNELNVGFINQQAKSARVEIVSPKVL